MASLAGQHVVVLGGSSGIGFAVAEAALTDGAKVTIGSSGAANVASAAERLGGGAVGRVVDVGDEGSLAGFFDLVGAFEHLVFTAGDWGGAVLGGNSVDQIDFATVGDGLRVRFWGALKAVKHAKAHIAPTGSITLTDGVLAHRPQKGAPLTAAFGGALEFLVKGLAVDLAPIRVNTVCPGLVLTGRVRQMMPEAMIGQMTARQPLPRAAQPSEAAEAYLYAMRAGYTTGQVLIVDGGGLLA